MILSEIQFLKAVHLYLQSEAHWIQLNDVYILQCVHQSNYSPINEWNSVTSFLDIPI